ncbi:MAG: alpha/beta hydrolase [Pseudomonadota bacterium]
MVYQPRRVPRHERLALRGLDHHLTCWGPSAGTPWVMLHGWADTSDTFQFVVDAFGRQRRVVAPDWRGFGRSQWQGTPYWFADYVADLDALLDHLSPAQPVSLVGHSMGGNVACLYAGIRPERVVRVVNLEGLGMRRTRPDEAPARYRRWLDELKTPPTFARYESLERFAAVLRRRNPRLTEDRAAFIAASWSKALPEGGYTVSSDPAHKLVNPMLYRRDEAEACWQAATAPLLLVLGALSDLVSQLGDDASEAYLRAHYPTLQFATVPAAGHMLHHEEPEAVAALIEGFLDGPAP